MTGRLKGKIALVTGGSGGLGLADVIDFVKEGIDTIIINGTDERKLQEAEKKAKKYGDVKIILSPFDVTKEEEWERAIQELENQVPRLDILVNNAGVNKRDIIQDCTLEDWNWIINVNQTGVFLGMKHSLPLLKKSKSASIVNISSIVGVTGYYAVAYTATKWAVRGMTKSAALEFGKWGIRVNSVNPGFIKTALNESIQPLINASNKMNPLERAGKAEEVAQVVTFLASDESSYINGTDITIDGGLTAGGQFKALADQFEIY